MRLRPFIVLAGIASLLVLSSFPQLKVAKARSFSSIWFEPFSGPEVHEDFDGPLEAKWKIYRGNPTIVEAAGRPSVLKLAHPEAGDALGSFGSKVGTSLFLVNPVTSEFADGMIEFDIYFDTSSEVGTSAMLTFRMQSDDSYYGLRLTSTRDWHSGFAIYSKYDSWKDIGWSDGWSEIGWSGYTAGGLFPTRTWSHVIVTVAGSRLSCYKDGLLMSFAEDRTWSQGHWGGIGLQTNYYGGIIYVDNFRIPGRMKWNSYRGSPRIDSNFGKSGSSMFFDHPSIFGDEASFGSQDSCSAFISDPDLRSFENGIVEFDMYFDNDAGQKAFVTFRMENDQSYYAARITSTHDWPGYFVKRTGADDWYSFGSKSYFWAFAPQVWFHVVIVIDGNHFELWRDMERLFSGDDWSLPRGKWGGIGFYCAYYQGSFHIDNLKICVQV
jgi:hypothetical protein